MKIVFFGTPTFAAITLKYLLQHGVNVVAVITKPDKAKGRSAVPVATPVKVVTQTQNPPLPLFQPALVSAPEFSDILKAFDADLFVVVAYGEIIKQHLLDMPRLGCINVHASLLPKYRGAAPIQRSIINGDHVTGITIMHMVRKMDAGDIIQKVEVAIAPNDSFPEVENALCEAGCKVLLEVIHRFETGPVQGVPQHHEIATYAPKIELEDCQITWTLPAQQIHDLVRGVTPEPGAWCYVSVRGQKKRMKIFKSRVESDLQGTPASILTYGKEGLVVASGQGAIRILELQLEGKKTMTATEFVLGLPKEQLSFQTAE